MELTQALVRELFDYHEDGYLVWREDRGVNKTGGKKAGHNRGRYYTISYYDKNCQGHRAIFLWHHGHLPKIVDHIDRDPANNKIENLRACDDFTSCQNQNSRKNSSSKYKGVSFHTKKGNWRAYVQAYKNLIYLGSYASESEAAMAYNEAALELHGTFAVLNENPLNNIPLEDWA